MSIESGTIGDKEFESITREFSADMKDFFQTVEEDIKEVIDQGIKDGLSLQQIQDNISNLFLEGDDGVTNSDEV
jgi:hypothetical protein